MRACSTRIASRWLAALHVLLLASVAAADGGMVQFDRAVLFVDGVDRTIEVPVSRWAGDDGPIEVDVQLADGSVGASQVATLIGSNTVSFADGEVGTKSVEVRIHDVDLEGSQYIVAHLTDVRGAGVFAAQPQKLYVHLDDGSVDPFAFVVDGDRGADSNSGSLAAPFETIQRGVDAAVATGSRVYIRQSSRPYRDNQQETGADHPGVLIDYLTGSDTTFLRIEAFPGEHPIVDNAYEDDVFGFIVGIDRGDDGPITSHVWIDGLEIRRSGVGIMAHRNADNEFLIVTRSHIHHLRGDDNIGAVRLDFCDFCIVAENVFHHTYETDSGSNPFDDEPYGLHSGVHGYQPGYAVVENNLMYNLSKGVFQKHPDSDLGDSEVVRRNQFVNVIEAFSPRVNNALPGTRRASFYDNLVLHSESAVHADNQSPTMPASELKIFNNTLVDTQKGLGRLRGIAEVEVFNNLRVGQVQIQGVSQWDFMTVFDSTSPNQIEYFDNQLYFDHSSKWVLNSGASGQLGGQRVFNGLAEWQDALSDGSAQVGLGFNPDLNSIEADPLFVDPENGDYRLQPGSPAEGRGRFGGTLGALRPGIEIGPSWVAVEGPLFRDGFETGDLRAWEP
ncbi:MAG: DUF5123 domain-containing protein [Thermoanaerobaculia bacterium]|nr:DUF5123 domain-containing protein [Thermoanaerobaculia bacterium]